MIWAVHTLVNTFIDSWTTTLFMITSEKRRKEFRDDTVTAMEKFIEAIKLMNFEEYEETKDDNI